MTPPRSGTVIGQDPLEAADKLVGAGQVAEAIDALTEANRSERHVRYERRLVQLRHELFETLGQGARQGAWPPEGPDDIAGRGAIPVITPAELNPSTLRSGIVHHGCVHVPGLISSDRVDELVAGVDLAFEAYDHRRSAAADDPWFAPFELGPVSKDKNWPLARSFVRQGGGVYTAESPRMLFEVLDTFDALGVTEAIAGYLGERPAVSVEKATLRRASPEIGSADWHQDGAFLGADVRSVNVWVALTDCGEDAPGLDIVPRRMNEILRRGTHGAHFDWSVGHDLAVEAAGDGGTVRPSFKAGDALFFDQWLLHRTAVSAEMSNERHALETWFFAPSAYPEGRTPLVV